MLYAGNTEKDFEWMYEKAKAFDAEVINVSTEYGQLASITFLPKNSTFCSNSNGFISDTSIFTYCWTKSRAYVYLLVVNAGNTEKDFEWMYEKAKAFDAEVINVSTKSFSVFPALTTKR
jgi:glycine cleavage system aminomethyltransferase T